MAVNLVGIDVFASLKEACNFSYQIFVLEGTIKELEKIMGEQRRKYKDSAKLSLKLLEVKKIKTLPSEGDVDDALVDYSKKGYLVLTQDVELKKRLEKPYLTIRQKKRIILVN